MILLRKDKLYSVFSNFFKINRKDLNNWPIFSSCNPFPSLPSAAKDNLKYQFLRTSSVIVNKIEPLF